MQNLNKKRTKKRNPVGMFILVGSLPLFFVLARTGVDFSVWVAIFIAGIGFALAPAIQKMFKNGGSQKQQS